VQLVGGLLSAACGTSILTYCTWGTCSTRSVSRLAGSGVGDRGASCTMTGMSIAPATVLTYSITPGPATVRVGAHTGKMTVTEPVTITIDLTTLL
jgi:hypothetical protein